MIEREFNVKSSSSSSNNNITSSAYQIATDNFLFNDSELNSMNINNNNNNNNNVHGKVENKNLNMMNDIHEINNSKITSTRETNYQRHYENNNMKFLSSNRNPPPLPPVPKPRLNSLPQKKSQVEIDSNAMVMTNSKSINNNNNNNNIIINNNNNNSTSIESWLKDAKAINREDDKSEYEATKFEFFAAVNDDEDEKLGPPELMNIGSEAYFKFPWCENHSSNSLPTIGEAEEENFPSIEFANKQNLNLSSEKVIKK
jgi:molecular chaperone DnaK (HSP70)